MLYLALPACSAQSVGSFDSDLARNDGFVEYARGAESTKYPEAGFLTNDRFPSRSFCSATVIPPGNRVLTARHCIDEARSRQGLRFGIAPKANDPSADFYQVTNVAPYGSGDLAVLTLDRATPYSGIPVDSTPPAAGTKAEIAGYGLAEADAPGGTKRLTEIEVQNHSDHTFRMRDPSAGGTCSGDSGGGVIANTPSGPRIIGVVSSPPTHPVPSQVRPRLGAVGDEMSESVRTC